MILDKLNEFCSGYALSGGAGNSDVIDLGAAGDAYKALWLVAKMNDAAAAGGTNAAVKLQTSDTEAFTTAVDLPASSGTVVTAALTANKTLIKQRLPLGCKRYLRLNFAVTGTFTAGAVHGFLTPDISIREKV